MTNTVIIGISILTAVLVLFLKQYRLDYALVVSAAAGVVIFIIIISEVSGLIDEFNNLFSLTGLDDAVLKIVLKSLGICYLTVFASDLCKDFGQNSLSGKIELSGKVVILGLTFPLVKQILSSALELIG